LFDGLELKLCGFALSIVRKLHLKGKEQTLHTADQVGDARFLKWTPMNLKPLAADFLNEPLLDAELKSGLRLLGHRGPRLRCR